MLTAGTLVFQCSLSTKSCMLIKEEEYGLVSKPVWVHCVDGHFMIEPVPDPYSVALQPLSNE